MNFKVSISLFLGFSAFILSIVAVYKSANPKEAIKTEKEEITSIPENTEAPKIEIAHFMNRIQVFHNKLYYAGINNNAQLALFYLDEMEEEMGEIATSSIFDVDVNISENIEIYGLKQVENFRHKIKNDFTTFKSDFEQFTATCNSCHVVVKKDFIKIGIPTSPIFTNQIYTQD